jgi:hypothetical protein
MLEQNDQTVAKADKGRTIVIIDKNTLKHKVDTFIQENHIILLDKDLTEPFQSHIQQTIQKCDILVDKCTNT